MRRCSFVMSLIIAVLIAERSYAQSKPADVEVMTPGLWEITVQTRSPVLGPPLTHTVCIDRAHASRPEPPKSKKSDDCQVTPDASASNETAYTVRCAKRKSASTSKFTYSRDHFDGTVIINAAEGEVQQVFTAKRVGDCDDQPEPPIPPAH